MRLAEGRRQQAEDGSLSAHRRDTHCLSVQKRPSGHRLWLSVWFFGRTDANFDAENNLLSVCPLLSPSPLWQCSCYMRISSHTLHALMNWCEQGCLLHRLSFIHTSRVCPTSLHNYQLNLLLSREDLQASTILTSCRNLYLPVTRVLVCVCVSVRVKWNTKFLWLIWLALSGFFLLSEATVFWNRQCANYMLTKKCVSLHTCMVIYGLANKGNALLIASRGGGGKPELYQR